jgi:hypothetical protein
VERICCFLTNGGMDETHDREMTVDRERIVSLATRLRDVEFVKAPQIMQCIIWGPWKKFCIL